MVGISIFGLIVVAVGAIVVVAVITVIVASQAGNRDDK